MGDGPHVASTVSLYFEVQGPVLHSLPKYLESIGFQNPTDTANGAFTYWAGVPVWEWLKSNPAAEEIIGNVMQANAANRPGLSEVYPHANRLVENSGDGGVVLVDVGGSIGHDILTFARAHKLNNSGQKQLVLQDRPAVLENAGDMGPFIQKMEYDFFTPQPVQGAAAYYM